MWQPACLSADCIILSSSILSSLDTSQDPCENFYDFASRSRSLVCNRCSFMQLTDGGWLKAHPIPSDKGVFGNFEALAQQNRRVLQDILTSDEYASPSLTTSYDEQLMKKLRGLYASCMDEDHLNKLGTDPLAEVTNKIRKLLYRETTIVDAEAVKVQEKHITGLTAAIAYLHSRGVGGLFSAEIEGDVGNDPNFMTLWFSQPELGLPSKVGHDSQHRVGYRNQSRMIRNTTTKSHLSSYTKRYSSVSWSPSRRRKSISMLSRAPSLLATRNLYTKSALGSGRPGHGHLGAGMTMVTMMVMTDRVPWIPRRRTR